jgi:hypothetical protein
VWNKVWRCADLVEDARRNYGARTRAQCHLIFPESKAGSLAWGRAAEVLAADWQFATSLGSSEHRWQGMALPHAARNAQFRISLKIRPIEPEGCSTFSISANVGAMSFTAIRVEYLPGLMPGPRKMTGT